MDRDKWIEKGKLMIGFEMNPNFFAFTVWLGGWEAFGIFSGSWTVSLTVANRLIFQHIRKTKRTRKL